MMGRLSAGSGDPSLIQINGPDGKLIPVKAPTRRKGKLVGKATRKDHPMTYRSLLTVFTDRAEAGPALDAAVTLARHHDAHLDVLCLGLDATRFSVGLAEIDPTATVAAMREARRTSAAVAEAVRDRLRAEDVRWAVEDAGAEMLGIAGVVAPRARFADLVVLPRPLGDDRPAAAEDVMEAALFGGHAPVLIVPPGRPLAWPPTRVVIGWDGGDEAMAAVRAAQPLLGAASASVAVVDQGRWGTEGDDPGGALARYLVRHGVTATVTLLPRGAHSVAEVLETHVRDTAADLLVMGAYAHSRMREMILGGTTRDMLRGATVPVLMAR